MYMYGINALSPNAKIEHYYGLLTVASVSTPGVWPTAMPLHVNKKTACKITTLKKSFKTDCHEEKLIV